MVGAIDWPGSKQHNSKLTDLDVLKIRQLKIRGVSNKTIANEFNIHPDHVKNIVAGKRWKHLL